VADIARRARTLADGSRGRLPHSSEGELLLGGDEGKVRIEILLRKLGAEFG
jgi:hypothetical protein